MGRSYWTLLGIFKTSIPVRFSIAKCVNRKFFQHQKCLLSFVRTHSAIPKFTHTTNCNVTAEIPQEEIVEVKWLDQNLTEKNPVVRWTQWTFLEHKGPIFSPPYESLPENIRFKYNGTPIKLSKNAEEIAGFYSRFLDHDYTKIDKFNNNFFVDWRKYGMNTEERKLITDFVKCDFTELNEYYKKKSDEKKTMSKEDKKKLKEENEAKKKEYGTCTIDGRTELIGNFIVEPPGLFRGRGDHPKMGMLKQRILPEDVIINCSKDSKIPSPPPGHQWKEVRHDDTVTWLASWMENVQGKIKYVYLNPASQLKGESDRVKFEKARELAKHVYLIRQHYINELESVKIKIRQRAVALYFIDKLALRSGFEKDDDEADTVGCCSLRCEHVTLVDKKDDLENVVVFNFLGKDSVRYYNEVPVEEAVYNNLKLFLKDKKPENELFDQLNTHRLNRHMGKLMNGLTAKVFRTYNASHTLQTQLDLLTPPDGSPSEKMLAYNRANRAVAVLCNHQRTIPKSHEKSMENIDQKIEKTKEDIQMLSDKIQEMSREKLKYEKKTNSLRRKKEQLEKLTLGRVDKEEGKEFALSTSRLNYLDPRISVSWCLKHDIPIEKVFNKTTRSKFSWAIEMVSQYKDFRFD